MSPECEASVGQAYVMTKKAHMGLTEVDFRLHVLKKRGPEFILQHHLPSPQYSPPYEA